MKRRRLPLILVALVLLLGAGAAAWATLSDPEAPARSRSERPERGGVARHAPVMVAVAGDIGHQGTGRIATARLVTAISPAHVITTGDHAYPDGAPDAFARWYAPTWGRFRAATHPSPGNHDYKTPDADGYFDYFGDAAGPRGKGYYAFDIGAWHLVALNTEIAHGPRSAQVAWLRDDLRRSRARCTLAFWHRPRFTAGRYADDAGVAAFWRVLHRAGAEVVLSSHDHNYQRYAPLDPAGRIDRQGGIRQFVVGTGGAPLYPLRPDRRRVAGTSDSFGVLVLRLRGTGLDFEFVPAGRTAFRDAGSNIRCR